LSSESSEVGVLSYIEKVGGNRVDNGSNDHSSHDTEQLVWALLKILIECNGIVSINFFLGIQHDYCHSGSF
jgi:hypothetical protein